MKIFYEPKLCYIKSVPTLIFSWKGAKINFLLTAADRLFLLLTLAPFKIFAYEKNDAFALYGCKYSYANCCAN